MTITKTTAYIGIGSNFGDPLDQVQRAILRLTTLPKTHLKKQSSLFRTTPVDADGDNYINAVASIETQLPALVLLQELQSLEQAFGRERPYVNAPRTLDLDLLLYGNQEILSESLVVPHPRLTQRAFALIPLLQINPMIVIAGQGYAHTFVPNVAGQVIHKICD
jgi:2-amino-4-hydroxy-6-hydroxymethyldihydropteridine diphosphokinase